MTTAHPSSLIQEGLRLWRAGRRREALASATHAAPALAAVTDPQAQDSLGTLLTHLEQPERAVTHFDIAVRHSAGKWLRRPDLSLLRAYLIVTHTSV